MRSAILLVVLLAVARGQDTAPDRDPATFFPLGTPIWFEADGISAAASSLRGSLVTTVLPPPTRELVDGVLADLAAVKVRRAAIGVLPALIFPTRWIAVLETSEPEVLLAKIEKRKPSPEFKPASAEVAPFFVVADSKDTIETVVELRDGKARSLLERDDFKRFRGRTPPGVVRWHVDVKKLAPTAFRLGLDKRDDAGGVLFGQHLTHVLKTARTLSGGLALDGRIGVTMSAEVTPVPQLIAFTETRPSQTVLAPPPGCALRLSLPRDLRQFWNDRGKILAEAARAPLAEFQNNLGILMGGLAVEDVFAGLGSAFDFYVSQGDPAAPDGHRFPSAAIVAVVQDQPLKTEMLLGFQTTVGIVNAQRAQEGQPRLLQDSTRHREVLIASARILRESVADENDDRLQLDWSFAIANDRLIIGTNRAIVTSLVNQALDGRTMPRPPGDDVEFFGPPGATLIEDAGAFLRARMALGEGRSAEESGRILDAIALLLSKTARGHARFDVEGEIATFDVALDAPDLVRKSGEGR